MKLALRWLGETMLPSSLSIEGEADEYTGIVCCFR